MKLCQHWNDGLDRQSLDTHIQMLTHGEEIFTRDTYYAKVFDIIQSSGTGKSRLIRETGSKMFVVSFALRKKGETGFPLEIGKYTAIFNKAVHIQATRRNICL